MTFDKIYQAALKKDKKLLQHVDVDIKKKFIINNNIVSITPAAKLALEKQYEAVEFLRGQGADMMKVSYVYQLLGNRALAQKYRSYIKDEPDEPEEEIKPAISNSMKMQILGGFVAALGIAAVAVGLVFLSASTFGAALAVGIGVAAILTGVGIFSYDSIINAASTPERLEFNFTL